jgi:hypothetical protein
VPVLCPVRVQVVVLVAERTLVTVDVAKPDRSEAVVVRLELAAEEPLVSAMAVNQSGDTVVLSLQVRSLGGWVGRWVGPRGSGPGCWCDPAPACCAAVEGHASFPLWAATRTRQQ